MRQMKDSGIEWIGEIPESWKVISTKHLFSIISGATPKSENPDYFDGNIIWITPADYKTEDIYVSNGRRNITDLGLNSCNTSLIPEGSIIFSKRAPIGSVAINSVELCTNQGCLSCIPAKELSIKLYYYIMSICSEQYNLLGSGTTFKEISATSFSDFKLPLPPLPEQQAISAYLDRQCSHIDNIIEKTKASVEKYKKLRQAVITQAVTKGIRGDRPMKDSGIEGLGNISDNWIIAPIKRILIEITDRTLTGEGNPLSVNQKKGVVPASESGAANPSQSTVDWRIVSVNDIVFNKYKAHSGVFFVSQYEGIVTFNYSVFRCINGNNPKFFEYLFKTNWCIGEFRKQMHGVGDSISPLYTRDLFKINIIIPSLDEQKEIVAYLDQKCAEIDSLISKKEQFLTELEAYKKSLIYEYVTGKKEVPQA